MNWKTIPNYSNYSISLNGEIKNNNSGYIFKKKYNHDGYIRVQLTNDLGKTKTCAIHRLMAITYLPNFYNKETVDHVNKIKDDNRLINLRWYTHQEQSLNKTKSKRCINDNINLHGEIWKKCDINDIQITVSNLGRIQMKNTKTYGSLLGKYYNIVYNKKTYKVHRLVALAFLKNDDKTKNIVNHIDGNKANNNVINLEWCTASENMIHSVEKLKNGTSIKIHQIDPISNQIINTFDSLRSGATATNLSPSLISLTCTGKIKTGGGFIWKYANNNNIKNKILPKTNKLVCKKVKKIDPHTKEIINIYDSIKDATLDNNLASNSSITSVCKGRTITAGGYLWEYVDYDSLQKQNIQMKKIIKIDKKTNLEICRYDSIKEAAIQNNIKYTCISKVCQNKQKTSGGFIWKYVV